MSVVKCLVGQINGVTAVILNGKVDGVAAGLDEEAEVNVAVILSAVVRRRVPARGLALDL